MRINGTWIGWGIGDWSHNPGGSDRDPTVRKFRGFARRMYRSYMGHLADNNKFDQELLDAVMQMQDKLVAGGKLVPGNFIRGVLDLETQYASGFRKRPASNLRPFIFTTEGHMSNMWHGPAAYTARAVEEQQLCWWHPNGYDSNKIPFNNKSGIDNLVRMVSSLELPGPNNEKRPFPRGTNWGGIGFSQGDIIWSEFLLQHVIPSNGTLHWRYPDLKRSMGMGAPYREIDQCADWVPDKPKPGTRGISDKWLETTKIKLPNGAMMSTIHREVARTKDIYTENETNERGLNKTAIYKIVSENSWSGGPAGMLSRVVDLFTNPFDGMYDIILSIMDGAMFVPNMGPHGLYDLGPCIEWMKGVRL